MPRRLTLFRHTSVFVHRCLRMPSYLRYTFLVWFPVCLCASFVSPCVLLLRPDSAEGFSSCPSTGSRNEEKDWENDSTTSSTPSNAEYTGIRQTCNSPTSSQPHQIAVSHLFFFSSRRTQTVQGAEREVQQTHHPERPGSLLPCRQGQRGAEEQNT